MRGCSRGWVSGSSVSTGCMRLGSLVLGGHSKCLWRKRCSCFDVRGAGTGANEAGDWMRVPVGKWWRSRGSAARMGWVSMEKLEAKAREVGVEKCGRSGGGRGVGGKQAKAASDAQNDVLHV